MHHSSSVVACRHRKQHIGDSIKFCIVYIRPNSLMNRNWLGTVLLLLVLQVAIPMILYSLENPTNYDPKALTDTVYLWRQKSKQPWATYTTTVTAYHSWKTQSVEDMKGILEAMGRGDPTLKTLVCSICHP